jgi:iron complex outermembrane receptor protein
MMRRAIFHPSSVRSALTSTLVALAWSAGATAQQATLAGSVTDSVSGRALDGVSIELRRDGAVAATATSTSGGDFSLVAPAGRYALVVRRLDYRPYTRDDITLVAGEPRTVALRLVALPLVFDPVVISASRAEEKALDAPAAVTVVDQTTVTERPALTAIDHVYAVPGMQVATTGISQHEVVSRGFNNAASGAMMALADNRYVSVPSLRINVYNFIPLTDEDIERLEIVRGPGSALYGPNSANGVLHIISRSPLDDPGTTLTLSGGERSVVHGQLRHASRLSDQVAIKVSGQYLQGRDWPYDDPQEALARDTTVERASGEVRVDWSPKNDAAVVAAVGVNHAFSNVDLTPLGAAQVRDWRSSYAQVRTRVGRFFGQVYANISDAGDTYLLRTGDSIVDKSQMFVAQVQHGTLVGSRTNLTYGIDVQRTVPRTEGSVTGRNEDDDVIDEAGAYVQAEVDVSPALRLVLAGRGDYHNRLSDPVFSPRAALVFKPSRDHTTRLTYNRAFSTPTTNNLFLDIVGGSLPTPVPTTVRLVGVPTSGFSFRRDCDGGLCMRSPYTPAGLGGGEAYLPLDVTLLWPTVVQLAAAQGVDLSPVPPPSSAEVRTVLAKLDIGTGTFTPVNDVADIPTLTPTIENVVEFGYRGVVAERFSFGIDVYHAWKNDFVGAERVETPSAFFHEDDLRDYLIAVGAQADTAAALATLIGSIPAATVTPQEARDPWDILVTYRNVGRVSYWGSDIEASAMLTPVFALRANYSWVSANEFPFESTAGVTDTIPLNAPAQRAAFSALFRCNELGLNVEARARWVDEYPVRSGVYVGTVPAYAVVDALVGYRLPFAPQLRVSVSALNLLDNAHIEFVGAPPIGRLVTGSIRAEF